MFQTKIPDAGMKLRLSDLDFSFQREFQGVMPEAYERLLLDAMQGDPGLFARADEVETAWSIIDPILKTWQERREPKLHIYEPGGWGPTESTQWMRCPRPRMVRRLPGIALAICLAGKRYFNKRQLPQSKLLLALTASGNVYRRSTSFHRAQISAVAHRQSRHRLSSRAGCAFGLQRRRHADHCPASGSSIHAVRSAARSVRASPPGIPKNIAACTWPTRNIPSAGKLMGANPADFAPAALRLVAAGFDVIDINFGCPVKKVLGRCRGGFLLGQVETALEIVSRVREAVPPHVPVTVKMRRGLDDSAESREKFFTIFDGAFRAGRGGDHRSWPDGPAALCRSQLLGFSASSKTARW